MQLDAKQLIRLKARKEFIDQFIKQYDGSMEISLEALKLNKEVDFDGLIRSALDEDNHWQFLAERLAVFNKVPIQLGCICVEGDSTDYCNKRFLAEELERDQLLFPIYIKYLEIIANRS